MISSRFSRVTGISKWVLPFAAVYGGPAMTPKLNHAINEWPQNARGAIACDAVTALALSDDPAALLIVGSSLAELPLRHVLGSPRVYIMAAFRLLVLPIVLFLLLHKVVTDVTVLRIAVILGAMPVAASCTMLCLEYGGDQEFAAQGTFLTTLLSVITIPLLAAALL